VGSSCGSDGICASGNCYGAPAGTCYNAADAGQSCTTNNCAHDLTCAGTTCCIPPGSTQHACNGSSSHDPGCCGGAGGNGGWHLALSWRTLEIYNWASEQRRSWRVGELDRALERRLRAVGLPLEVEACEWELAFSHVIAFHKRFGGFPSPTSNWRSWLDLQRELRPRGQLSAGREQRLMQLGAFDP